MDRKPWTCLGDDSWRHSKVETLKASGRKHSPPTQRKQDWEEVSKSSRLFGGE